MPRQDVPYGGAICRLKERIAEIWDKLGEKLHSINGVEGDAAGDVKIVSGDAAVVVTSDQVNHEIEIALDSSQLPAASVASVNGQTGAVALDAGDIPTVGGDVQSDIQDLANDISGNTTAINAEALARQEADSTLQTNINAATSAIPGAAAAAVAADNTIVRTSGNQNIADVKTVATEATGTYSQQIANSQKVKAELDNYAPMIRTTGNQRKTGHFMATFVNSTQIKNTSSGLNFFIFGKLTYYNASGKYGVIISSRNDHRSGYYMVKGGGTTLSIDVPSNISNPAKIKIVTDGMSYYFAVGVEQNEIIKVNFIFQCDSQPRDIPDTDFTAYAVTTETDVQVSP